MQSPEELAQQIVNGHEYLVTYPRGDIGVDSAVLTRLITAALQSYGDQRATAERDRCIWVASWHTSTSASPAHNNCARAIAAAIRALDT